MNYVRYAVPNLITSVSFVLGLAAIVTAARGEIEQAGWFIVWCVLLDIVDGIAARFLKATSAFGAEFDSFADVVAFGVAPAVLVLYFANPVDPERWYWWIFLACGIYALLAAIRLARFNSSTSVPAGWFQGIPTTACGALIATTVILLVRYEYSVASIDRAVAVSLVMFGLGLVMVSGLRFPKLALPPNHWVAVPYAVNIAAIYVLGVLKVWPEYLFLSAVVLVISGLIKGLRVSAGD